jgi:CubicO group peptidase (beta-lactamase class C family)
MRSNLLEPFGMTRSSFGWLDRYATDAATGHGRSGRPGLSGNGEYLRLPAAEKERLRKEFPDSSDDASSSAGLYTTATDYARFMIEIMSPRRRGEHHLSSGMLDEMLKPQVSVTPNISWGLGWGIEQNATGSAFGIGVTGASSVILRSRSRNRKSALSS